MSWYTAYDQDARDIAETLGIELEKPRNNTDLDSITLTEPRFTENMRLITDRSKRTVLVVDRQQALNPKDMASK